jgi:amylovoran biosynthesis protein AmsF
VFGQSQFNNGTDNQPLMNPIDGKGTGGRAVIHLQRKTSKAEASWSAEGSSPVVEVRFEPRTDTDTKVFVKLAGWTPTTAVLIKSTGKDRFLAGRCARVDATMTQGNPTSASKPAPQRFSLHNGKAGIGGNEQGDLLMASRLLKPEQVDTREPKGYVSVVINGEPCALPYFAIKS